MQHEPTDATSLSPCPFCGGTKLLVLKRTCDRNTPYNPNDRAMPAVRCMECYGEAVGKDWTGPQTAVEAWNRRASSNVAVESQLSITTWTEATFGTASSNARVAARANEEMAELLRALTSDDRHGKALEEAADIVIILYRLAQRMAEPAPRDWLPTFEELGAFINAIDKRKENLFRFVVIALNTWARPQTVLDFRDNEETVNRRFGTVDLNPPGRRQTIKYRPKIRLTDNLRGWLDHWKQEKDATEAPMMWDGEPIDAIKRTFVRHAEDCELPNFTPGTIRHFMATMVRREKPPVSKEQRDVWLGHDEKRTANAYEAFDPDYLADCMQATDRVLEKLQNCTARPLFACKLPARGHLKVIEGGRDAA